MPDWLKILQGIAEVGSAAIEYTQFIGFLKLDRSAAMQQLSRLVETLPPQQLDAFENDFLKYSLMLVDAGQRVRAMELYAWLKLAETTHYREFRGFVGSGNQLT